MKIITLCLATVFAGLAAGSALAAEGKLNFIGKVVNASCKLEGVSDSGVIGVSMGAIPLSRLKNSQSGTGSASTFALKIVRKALTILWLTAPRLPARLKTACWRSTAAASRPAT